MATPLERLLAAQKKAAGSVDSTPAAAPAAPAAQAAAAVVQPAPAAPAPAAPITTAAPAAQAAPVVPPATQPIVTAAPPPAAAAAGPEDLTAAAATLQATPPAGAAPATTAVAVATGSDNLPVHVRTEEEAQATMVALFGKDALSTSKSLADVADVDGSGMRLAWPFAQIRKGNWSVHKSCPETIKEFMPVGGEGMPFHAIYIAHRVGVTLWQGDPSDGNPPVGAYVVPSMRVTQPPELAEQILRETMKVGSKIQFTPSVDRDRYFPEGKLTPEVHVLVWTPNTGYILLVAPGYNSTQDTLENLKGDIEQKYPLWPLCFSLKKHEVINKNAAPGAKNSRWEHFSIEAKLNPNAKSQAVAEAWNAYKTENMKDVMNKAMIFLKGEDHSGMTIDQIVELLAVYNQRIAALPARKRS